MSGFQIFILIWISLLTLGFLFLLKICYVLVKVQLDRDAARNQAHTAFSDLRDPKNNPFLRAGLDAVREGKKRG